MHSFSVSLDVHAKRHLRNLVQQLLLPAEKHGCYQFLNERMIYGYGGVSSSSSYFPSFRSRFFLSFFLFAIPQRQSLRSEQAMKRG